VWRQQECKPGNSNEWKMGSYWKKYVNMNHKMNIDERELFYKHPAKHYL
jgi:hypothetical protein